MRMVRPVPRAGRDQAPGMGIMKCRIRGQRSGAEDGERWEERAKHDAGDGDVVAAFRGGDVAIALLEWGQVGL